MFGVLFCILTGELQKLTPVLPLHAQFQNRRDENVAFGHLSWK